jgi:hypothetical protein
MNECLEHQITNINMGYNLTLYSHSFIFLKINYFISKYINSISIDKFILENMFYVIKC